MLGTIRIRLRPSKHHCSPKALLTVGGMLSQPGRLGGENTSKVSPRGMVIRMQCWFVAAGRFRVRASRAERSNSARWRRSAGFPACSIVQGLWLTRCVEVRMTAVRIPDTKARQTAIKDLCRHVTPRCRTSDHLARISHIRGASGRRIRQKLFCENDLSRFGGVARCRRSVARNRACLDRSKGGLLWPRSTAAR